MLSIASPITMRFVQIIRKRHLYRSNDISRGKSSDVVNSLHSRKKKKWTKSLLSESYAPAPKKHAFHGAKYVMRLTQYICGIRAGARIDSIEWLFSLLIKSFYWLKYIIIELYSTKIIFFFVFHQSNYPFRQPNTTPNGH